MEGFAIMAALKHANGAECKIYTDSEFWINVIIKWCLTWEANGWQKEVLKPRHCARSLPAVPFFTRH